MVRFSGEWVACGWLAGDGRIGGGGFCCAKSVVGGPACEWVLKDGLAVKDGSAVSGLLAAVGGCVGCGGWRWLCFAFGAFFFFFFLVVVNATIFLVVVFFFFF